MQAVFVWVGACVQPHTPCLTCFTTAIFAECPEALMANVEGWVMKLVVRGEAPRSAAS